MAAAAGLRQGGDGGTEKNLSLLDSKGCHTQELHA